MTPVMAMYTNTYLDRKHTLYYNVAHGVIAASEINTHTYMDIHSIARRHGYTFS